MDEKYMDMLLGYLEQAVKDGASDLFLTAGAKVHVKKDKRLQAVSDEIIMPRDSDGLVEALYLKAGRPMDAYRKTGDDDFSLSIPGLARFRVNAYQQRGSRAAVVRVVMFGIPDWKGLSIPESVMAIADMSDGMVLFTGTAGSGKSTTQACIVDRINQTRDAHVITLEDPIEFIHRNDRSIVTQREIAIDTKDYPSALRACLRQAPDVIQLGEMRDHDTIATAMTAAETGHLVIATLHVKGAVNAVDRVVDSFPAEQQDQVRAQLGMVLRTVVAQQLLPDVGGGLVPAFEVMHMTNGIRSMVREGKTHQVNSLITAGAQEGMFSMDQSILRLCQEGRVSKETALLYADNPDQLRKKLA